MEHQGAQQPSPCIVTISAKVPTISHNRLSSFKQTNPEKGCHALPVDFRYLLENEQELQGILGSCLAFKDCMHSYILTFCLSHQKTATSVLFLEFICVPPTVLPSHNSRVLFFIPKAAISILASSLTKSQLHLFTPNLCCLYFPFPHSHTLFLLCR